MSPTPEYGYRTGRGDPPTTVKLATDPPPRITAPPRDEGRRQAVAAAGATRSTEDPESGLARGGSLPSVFVNPRGQKLRVDYASPYFGALRQPRVFQPASDEERTFFETDNKHTIQAVGGAYQASIGIAFSYKRSGNEAVERTVWVFGDRTSSFWLDGTGVSVSLDTTGAGPYPVRVYKHVAGVRTLLGSFTVTEDPRTDYVDISAILWTLSDPMKFMVSVNGVYSTFTVAGLAMPTGGFLGLYADAKATTGTEPLFKPGGLSVSALNALSESVLNIGASKVGVGGDYTFIANLLESGGKGLNRLLAKALAADPDSADSVAVGLVRDVVKLTALTSGEVDLSKAGVLNRILANLKRSGVNPATLDVIAGQLADSGHAGSAMQESGGKGLNRLLAKALAADPDTHDSVLDGLTYGRLSLIARTQVVRRIGTHGQNLAFNAGMEDGAGGVAPPFWSLGTIVVDSLNAQSGNNYVSYSSPPATSNDSVQVDETGAVKLLEVNQGDVIKFGGWVKRTAGDASVGVLIGVGDKDQANFTSTITLSATPAVWTKLTGEYVVPAGKKYVYYGFSIRSDGTLTTTLSCDDFFFKILRPTDDLLAGTLRGGINESGGKAVNRLFAKGLPADPDTADAVAVGLLRDVVKLTALTSGEVDFSKAGVVNRVAAHLLRQAAGATLQSIVANLTDASHAGSAMQESGGKAVNRLFAKGLAADPDTHDSVLDGLSYGRLYLTARTQAFRRVGTHGQNLLFNEGFEDGTAFWSEGSSFSVVTDSTKAHSGNKYLQLAPPATLGGFARQSEETAVGKYFQVNPGDVVGFGGWAYRESGDGAGHYVIEITDKDQLNPTYLGSGDVTAAAWTLIANEYVVAAGKKYIRLYAELSGGTVATIGRFDDAFLKVLRPTSDLLAGALRSGVNESAGKAVNRLFAKPLAADPDSLDSAPDGVSYARMLGNRLASGAILRAGAFSDGSYALLASATDGLTAGLGVKESGAKALNRLLAKALAGDADSLDGTPDGVTYKRITGVSSSLVQTASIADASVTKDKTEARNRCRVRRSADKSITSGGLTLIDFDLETYDAGGLHDNVTNSSRITVPTGGNKGVWFLMADIEWALNNNGGRLVQIKKNGVTVLAMAAGSAANTANLTSVVQSLVAVDDAPGVGDYYECEVLQDSGVALNVMFGASWFGAQHLW